MLAFLKQGIQDSVGMLGYRIVRKTSFQDLMYRAAGAPAPLIADGPAKNPIIVACMPKSGSTWLTQALRAVTGYSDIPVSSHWAIQELDPVALARHQCFGLVGHIHLIPSPYTIGLLNHYQVKIIILTRKLPDIIVSLREFFYAPEIINQLKRDGVLQSSFYMIDHKFYDLSEKEQYDYLIDFALPWYLWFAASWQKFKGELRHPSVWLSYDELMADRVGVLARTVESLNLLRLNDVDKSIGALGNTRLNVGVSGRGYMVLSGNQIDTIRNRATRYLTADLNQLL
jgi:hypothetical protein